MDFPISAAKQQKIHNDRGRPGTIGSTNKPPEREGERVGQQHKVIKFPEGEQIWAFIYIHWVYTYLMAITKEADWND